MASSLGILTGTETAIYSENILNNFLKFNNIFTWNVVSGGANGVSENNISGYVYAGVRSLQTTFTGTGVLIINSGGTQSDVVVKKDGNYIISYRCAKNDAAASIDVGVYVYVNGIPLDYNKFEQTLHNSLGFVDGRWNCYFQYLSLLEGDVVSFQFDFQSDVIGSKLYLDGLKLELVDRALGLPSLYLEPLTIIEYPKNIDFPSIANNTIERISFVMTGAAVGDYRPQIQLPVAMEALNLTFWAYVSASDEVTFCALNTSGAAIDPTAYNVNFKITK